MYLLLRLHNTVLRVPRTADHIPLWASLPGYRYWRLRDPWNPSHHQWINAIYNQTRNPLALG
uniref:Uncharacterized protein n=1 Tax=Talaromyces marneffei PM1 TaxID=1077442 RepID=A0A093V761_TALMA